MDLKSYIQDHFLKPNKHLSNGRVQVEYLEKNHPEFYKKLLIQTSFLGETETMSERFYAVLNGIKSKPLCICGTPVRYWRKGEYNLYCSERCQESILENRKSIQNSLTLKFGGPSAFCSPDIHEKAQRTIKENGNTLINPKVRAKYSATMQSLYKVNHAFQSKELLDKSRETCKQKYGNEYPIRLKYFKDKVVKTNLKKYGVEYANQLESVKAKMRASFQLKYNRDNYQQIHLDARIIKFRKNKVKYKKWLEILHHKKRLSLPHIGKILGLKSSVWRDCVDLGVEIKFHYRSSYEIEIFDYIKTITTDSISYNTRSEIGKELDIYVPSKKLAIEFNGLFWHSFNKLETSEDKNNSFNKTALCKEAGIRLLTIYENEWKDVKTKEIWKSIIRNCISPDNQRVHGRSCKSVVLDYKQAQELYEDNHLQGFVRSKVHLGLEYKNQTLAAMSFSPDANGGWALVRFVTKIGFHIPGGASKLLKFFISQYKPTYVTSFSDLRYSYGQVYKSLGFKEEYNLGPNYAYTDLKEVYHKRLFQKARLKKLLGDKFDTTLTESDLVFNYTKFRRIWDCGKVKFRLELYYKDI